MLLLVRTLHILNSSYIFKFFKFLHFIKFYSLHFNCFFFSAAEAVRKSVENFQSSGVESENSANIENDSGAPHTVVTNGQVCSRKWTQIHYLKVLNKCHCRYSNFAQLKLQLLVAGSLSLICIRDWIWASVVSHEPVLKPNASEIGLYNSNNIFPSSTLNVNITKLFLGFAE